MAMADGTKIEWADATVNAINGCSVVSPGCTNCYAMRLAGTRLRHHPSRAGLTIDSKAGPVWNGEVRLNEDQLMQPLRWKRPRRIFWNAHGDTFHDAVPDEWIDRIFAICALTPQHTHMILTKRSARMREYFGHFLMLARIGQMIDIVRATEKLWDGTPFQRANAFGAKWRLSEHWPLPNVWLGVSAEDQARANERIPDLLATPAAVRFISAEPLLGPIDLANMPFGSPMLDWVIAGGESGPGARPMHPDWARSLRDQCAEAGVAFHFKQWGEWVPCVTDHDGERMVVYPDDACEGNPAFGDEARRPLMFAHNQEFWRIGKARAGRTLDCRTHDEWPA
jgi:protein gp37